MARMQEELQTPNGRTMEATNEAYNFLFTTEEEEISEARKTPGKSQRNTRLPMEVVADGICDTDILARNQWGREAF